MNLAVKKWAYCYVLALLIAAGGVAVASPNAAFADDGRDSAPSTLTVTETLAANASDSTFNFDMAGNGTNGTKGRAKNDDSSSYVKIESITRSCRLYIDGAKTRTGTWHNCTVNGWANATKAGKWRIMNYVNERGYKYARLTGWANKGKTKLSGVWSPDSAGKYTAINA